METIRHNALIKSITPEQTTVEIVSESACSACHARSICSAGESKVKEIQVPTSGWDCFEVGEEVIVELKGSMGHKAVWLAYMVPLVILVAVLLGAGAAGLTELACGLAAIAATALYYFVLWLLKDKIQNEYNFIIKKK